MVGIEQGYQHFELVGADRGRQEADGIANAALGGSQHLQRIAHEIELTFSHLVGVEDEVLGLGTVGEDELGALLFDRSAAIGREDTLAVVQRQRQAAPVETC